MSLLVARVLVPTLCDILYRCYTVRGKARDRELEDLATRDRLLLAAAQLLDEAAGGPVSTRQITQRAGVRAPTLYHHFGSKQALLDEVVSHGFKEFLEVKAVMGYQPA